MSARSEDRLAGPRSCFALQLQARCPAAAVHATTPRAYRQLIGPACTRACILPRVQVVVSVSHRQAETAATVPCAICCTCLQHRELVLHSIASNQASKHTSSSSPRTPPTPLDRRRSGQRHHARNSHATSTLACPVANNYKTNSGPPTNTLALSAFTPYGTTTDTYTPKIHTTSNPAEA